MAGNHQEPRTTKTRSAGASSIKKKKKTGPQGLSFPVRGLGGVPFFFFPSLLYKIQGPVQNPKAPIQANQGCLISITFVRGRKKEDIGTLQHIGTLGEFHRNVTGQAALHGNRLINRGGSVPASGQFFNPTAGIWVATRTKFLEVQQTRFAVGNPTPYTPTENHPKGKTVLSSEDP